MTGVARNAACGLFGLALLAAGTNSGALAQDDESLDQKVISNVLSTFGLKSNQGDIDYKERSPLVLPPRVELPPPDSGTVVTHAPISALSVTLVLIAAVAFGAVLAFA